MKIKILSFVLFLACLSFSVFAEEWTCSKCDLPMNGNFCSNCGGAKADVAVVESPEVLVEDEKDEDIVEESKIESREYNILTVNEALNYKRQVIKPSEDRHVYYIKDYVGLTLSEFGSNTWDDKRVDEYGNADIALKFLTVEGNFINIRNNLELSNYIVSDQNIAPNTELNIEYSKNNIGQEYDNVIESTNISEIELLVIPKNHDIDKSKLDHIPLVTQCSKDKHLFYIKDYVGRNLYSFGYESWEGKRIDKYGEAHINFNFITEDGAYFDFLNKENLKKYVVKAQNVSPNTELNIEFSKNSQGKDTTLVKNQNIQEVELLVVPKNKVTKINKLNHIPEFTKVSTDKHLFYIKDYVGRNLASVGFESWDGTRNDKYGSAYLEIKFINEDGSFIPNNDFDTLKKYVIKAQSIKPHSELKLTYKKDSNGFETDNVLYKNYYEIEFFVTPLDGVLSEKKLDHVPEFVKTSTDNHLYYIKDYVGRNLASFGISTWDGKRADKYRDIYLYINIITENGTYLPVDNQVVLKKYVVKSQNVKPGSELQIVYKRDNSGQETSNVLKNNIKEIDLIVTPLNGIVEGKKLDHLPQPVQMSPNRHIHYVKDYVGRNLGTIGSSSWDGIRNDKYGDAQVRINYITKDGRYLPADDFSILKNYVVTVQSVMPDTELRISYKLDNFGDETNNLLTQSISEIDLFVDSLDENVVVKALEHFPKATKESTDRHLFYIKDYVGRNLATFGYSSWDGKRYDKYGKSTVDLIFEAENGETVPSDDFEAMKDYVVYEQSVAPDTELKIDFTIYYDGEESENSIERQSVQEIVLKIRKVNGEL